MTLQHSCRGHQHRNRNHERGNERRPENCRSAPTAPGSLGRRVPLPPAGAISKIRHAAFSPKRAITMLTLTPDFYHVWTCMRTQPRRPKPRIEPQLMLSRKHFMPTFIASFRRLPALPRPLRSAPNRQCSNCFKDGDGHRGSHSSGQPYAERRAAHPR
jgi:hypothetical protein